MSSGLARSLLLGALGALGTNACEPQELRLFSGVARDAGVRVVDVAPAAQVPGASAPDASPAPARSDSPSQPECLSSACSNCVAQASSCVFGATRWLCHPQTGECRAPCDPRGPAPQCPPGEQCHPQYGLCVECVNSADCSAPTPACDLHSNSCVGCTNAMDCASLPEASSCEPLSQRCVQCISDADCLRIRPDKPFCRSTEFECDDQVR